MWRFILVTFAFLGWSFYELSGGAEYQPRENSIQARAQQKHPHEAQGQGADLKEPVAENGANPVTLASPNAADGDRVQITLASVKTETVSQSEVRAEPETVEQVEAVETVETVATSIEAALQEAVAEDTVIASPLDGLPLEDEPLEEGSVDRVDDAAIRRVSGTVVNLREGPGTAFAKVAQLNRGTEVEVLYDQGDGWVELRVVADGQIGWIADWLITDAN